MYKIKPFYCDISSFDYLVRLSADIYVSINLCIILILLIIL